MPAQADLRSVASLEKLAETLNAAPASIEACLRETEDSLLPRLRELERAVENARDALRRAERSLESAQSTARDGNHEDDGRSDLAAAETAVEEARERLERIENAVADVRQALGRYKATAADLSTAKAGVLAQGAAYLFERVNAAHDYLSVRPSSENGTATAAQPVNGTSGTDSRPLATRAAEAVIFLGTLATQLSGAAYDVALLNDEFRQNHRLDAQTERLMDMLDQADGVSFELETEDQARKRQIEMAVRTDASPQIALFDPSLGSSDGGLF